MSIQAELKQLNRIIATQQALARYIKTIDIETEDLYRAYMGLEELKAEQLKIVQESGDKIRNV